MEKSIENIWKQGFSNHKELDIPKINQLYNQKSKNIVDRLIASMKKGTIIIVILTLLMVVFNSLMGNSFWGGILVASVMLPWYFLGNKQLKTIQKIDYNTNSYEYLKSINKKVKQLTEYNRKLTLAYTFVVLAPMVFYTYFNNKDKTISQIIGEPVLDVSSAWIFVSIPIIMILAWVVPKLLIRANGTTGSKEIEQLIADMEELRS